MNMEHEYKPPERPDLADFGVRIHGEDQCEGQPCPFHHPSDHHMTEWPKVIRFTRSGLVERTCPHGVGHPDPDSVDWFVSQGERKESVTTHGCDGCCSRQEIVADTNEPVQMFISWE